MPRYVIAMVVFEVLVFFLYFSGEQRGAGWKEREVITRGGRQRCCCRRRELPPPPPRRLKTNTQPLTTSVARHDHTPKHTPSTTTAKPGHHKEDLARLKVWNVTQALLTATIVLNAWQYYSAMLPQEFYVVDRLHDYVVANQVRLPFDADKGAPYVKAAEMFVDCTLGALLVLSTFVAHRMIVEKMESKKMGAAAVAAAKKDDGDAVAGGSGAASLARGEEAAQVVKAAAASDRTRSRRKMA